MDVAANEAPAERSRAHRTLASVRGDAFVPIGGLIVLVFLVFAIAPGLVTTHSPTQLDVANQLLPPSRSHPLGTDQLGRDLYTRIVYGTRVSLGMAFGVVVLGALFGTVVGAVAGFAGGFVDDVLMRVVDVFLSVPVFILAMAIAAVMGRGVLSLTLALAIVWWPGYARVVRGMVMAIKERPHVESARALGARPFYVVRRHVVPFTLPQLNVRVTQDMGYALVAVASLSFIGLGAQPPTPEWGLLLSGARTYITSAWWYPFFPGLAIALLTVGLSMLGDGIAGRIGVGEHDRGG